MAFDFPSAPTPGQVFTDGVVTYEWNGYAWAKGSGAGAAAPGDFVLKAGDTMTGPLTLSEHPTVASPVLQAATKGYVNSVALPAGAVEGQALGVNAAGVPTWGAPIFGSNF